MNKWPDEVTKFLVANVEGKTTKQLTELINNQGFDRKYGMIFSESQIKCAKSRHGLKSGTKTGFPKGYSPKYPPGVEEYIAQVATGKSTTEIADLVSEHFGIEFSDRQCRAYKKNHNINSGLTGRFGKGHVPANKGKKGVAAPGSEKGWFKKGHMPENHRQVGSERISKDGYVEIKTREPNKWELKHRVAWKKHKGEVPKGYIVVFRDGNKINTDINNLALISRSAHAVMNHTDLHEFTGELKETAIYLAELKVNHGRAKKRKGK